MEAKLAETGSFEIYIAPGENQPYTCLLVNLQSEELDMFHTTHNNWQYRRVAEKPPATRCEHIFTDDVYQTALFLAWDSFYDKLPDPNDKWDEVELLFRQAVPEWNELRFRIAALRRQYLEEALCQ